MQRTALLLGFAFLLSGYASADPIPVRYLEGATHGFLVLRNPAGAVLASGELLEEVQGARVTARLIFRFRDGSVDDDLTVFTQREQFHLLTDHHVQKGPFFPLPSDVLVNVPKQEVTVRSSDKDKSKSETHHMEFPPDLGNGLVMVALRNAPPTNGTLTMPYVAPASKPRLVKLQITPDGNAGFSVGGLEQHAQQYRIKVAIGGLAGVIAPIIGKQPADSELWIDKAKPPTFLRQDGPLYEGAPITTIRLSAPIWR